MLDVWDIEVFLDWHNLVVGLQWGGSFGRTFYALSLGPIVFLLSMP